MKMHVFKELEVLSAAEVFCQARSFEEDPPPAALPREERRLVPLQSLEQLELAASPASDTPVILGEVPGMTGRGGV